VAGKRSGLAGERSGLWFEFHRVLTELKPRWCIIENVAGLLSSNGGRDFATVLRGLEDIGYHASWRVFDSQYFGLAQRRKRVFIVGSFGNYSCVEVLFESESVSGHPAPSRETGSVSPTLSASSSGVSRPGGQGAELGFYVANTVTTREGMKHRLDCDTILPSYWDGGQLSDTLDVSVIAKQQMMPEKRRFPAVLDGQPNGVRRLTPLECEKLQGFPINWTEDFADAVRYRMMGNAVSVPVAEWIGKRIMTHDYLLHR